MSVILQAAAPTQMTISDSQKLEITNYINQYRKAHQAPELKWDDTIANFSQSWSNYLLLNNLFQHSGSQLYGENLAYFKGYGSDMMTLIKLSIDLWYKEVELYDFQKSGFTEATGHFTCLVWKSSKLFGLGFSIIDDTVVVSFNTSPPGNVIGEFDINVLPKIDSVPLPTPPPTPTPKPIVPPPSMPIVPTEPIASNKILKIINILYKIIDELKKKNSNKQSIIFNIKNLITDLIH